MVALVNSIAPSLDALLAQSVLQTATEIEFETVSTWEPTECTPLKKVHITPVSCCISWGKEVELLSCLTLRGPSVTELTNPTVRQTPRPAASYRKESENNYCPLRPK